MEEKGRLFVFTYFAKGTVPARDSVITVTKKGENLPVLIGYRKSDRNGKTKPVTIRTKDKILSETPGNKKPYVTVDVTIYNKNANKTVIKDVEIFADCDSILNIMLIPNEENISENTYVITPKNL